jgi:hypothetical protein
LTHEGLGKRTLSILKASGNPTRCGWLVMAKVMTVPLRSLKTSWLIIRTGRWPACSWPRAGLRSAQ